MAKLGLLILLKSHRRVVKMLLVNIAYGPSSIPSLSMTFQSKLALSLHAGAKSQFLHTNLKHIYIYKMSTPGVHSILKTI